MADIPANITTTAFFPGNPNNVVTFSGELETFGDVDWIKVSLLSINTYYFYGSIGGPGSLGDSEIAIYDSTGTLLASNDDAGVGYNSYLSLTPPTTGTYYVSIKAHSPVTPGGDYSITLAGVYYPDRQLTDGSDTYTGNVQYERILGGGGNDNITMNLAIHAYGEQGDDNIIGSNTTDYITGGTGNDTIYGGTGNDKIFGDSGHDYLVGQDDNDEIRGGSGNDWILGGTGNDTIWGDAGADYLDGGAGNDVYAVGGDKSDTIVDSAGIDTIQAGVTWSLAGYPAIERLFLTGTAAINGTGNALGNNIQGNAGANVLSGGNGNDSLQGNGGADTLTGGAGTDYFVYKLVSDSTPTVRDTITDFKDSGADKIHLDAVYAGTLFYVGTAGFSAAGQIRALQAGADVNVFVNVNGDTIADMQIVLKGTTLAQIGVGDFVL